MEYPKIHSLWKREGWYFDEKDKKGHQNPNRQSFIFGDFAQPEFENINKWRVEEKIDGTNIRVFWEYPLENGLKGPTLRFGGRTKDAQIPCHLLDQLQQIFTREKLLEVFPTMDAGKRVILFGEGYGAKIQKGGDKYRLDTGFILYDIHANGWWLKREDLEEIAQKLGIPIVPNLGMMTMGDIVKFVTSKPDSFLEPRYGCMEGVVCKTDPIMLFRKGDPIMWKLKCKEF